MSGFALFAVEMNPAGASPSPTVGNIYPQSLGRVGWRLRISIFLDIIIANPPKPVYVAVGWLQTRMLLHMFCDANTPYTLLRKPGTIIKRKADRHASLAMTIYCRRAGRRIPPYESGMGHGQEKSVPCP